MTINEYQKAALRTELVLANRSKIERLANGVMGLNGEAGEVVDLVKKHLFQGHKLDKEQVARELGDVAWYLAVSANAIDYDLETVLQMNIDKLAVRYPNGFEIERSIHRKKGDL